MTATSKNTSYGGIDHFVFIDKSVVASQNANMQNVCGSVLSTCTAPADGEVFGITASCESARTAGTCTLTLRKNGVNQTFSVVINAANPQYVRDMDGPSVAFSEGDELGCRCVASADWAAGDTPEVQAVLWVRLNIN